MAKFCVFCGQTPENKNAEHIIPQWLIEMTGKKTRTCHLGSVAPNGIGVAFGSFKFPACEKCNSEFSQLESQVKPIVVKILSSQPVSAIELSLLLDWFDKVRIGLWLADLCMTKTVDEIAPHMHITNRMGLKDRMLIIERVENRGDCVNFIGPGNLAFKHAPSAFQLHINDYTFTNVSEYGLVSRRLGFPYCDRMKFLDVEDVRPNTIVRGTGRISTPPVRVFTPTAEQTVIYQPMFKYLHILAPKLYDTSYVLEHSLDRDYGVGGIFYQRLGRPPAYLDEKSKLNLTPKFSSQNMFEMGIKTYELHNYVLQNTYTTKFASPLVRAERAAAEQALVKYNNTMIEICRRNQELGLTLSR